MVPRNRKPETAKTFAERVAGERKRLGSQSEVGRMVGIGQVSISNIEADMTKVEKVRAQTLFALADLFKVRARWLLWGQLPREPYLQESPEDRRLLAAWKEVPAHSRVTILASIEAVAAKHALRDEPARSAPQRPSVRAPKI